MSTHWLVGKRDFSFKVNLEQTATDKGNALYWRSADGQEDNEPEQSRAKMQTESLSN